MKDLYNNVLVTQVFNPANSTTTRTSSAIDLQGFNSLSVVVCMGQTGDTLSGSIFWTLKLTHSNDDVSYTDVPASEILSGVATAVINSNSLDETAYSFGYCGTRRYVKAVATPSGTHTTGTPIGMVALRGHPAYAPVV
ncbi:MAG: hypothetical protein K2Q01_05065 [Rickettsiales bacterium]|nr:hypothetical protein [Rickettsiales bacterium]